MVTESKASEAYARTDLPEASTVEAIPDGSNDSFRVRTVDDADDFVLKFNTFSKYETFRAEVRVLRYLEDNSELPTPEVVGAFETQSTDPRPFFATRYINGEKPDSLSDLYQPRLVRKMGAVILGLDVLPEGDLEGFGRVQPDSTSEHLVAGDASWREYYERYVHGVLDQAQWLAPARFEPYIEPLRNEFDEAVDAVPETPSRALILPDFRLDNLLVEDEDIEAILDFERADLGDAHLALANTHYLLSRDLSEPTADRVREDLAEGFSGWMDGDKWRAYRLGALAKEIRAFDHWWQDLDDASYEAHADRLEAMLEDDL